MNKAIIKGRITKDIELRDAGQTKVARFTIAVPRKVKKGEEKQADFISCVAFGTTAEFISKYFSKGKEIAVVGHIQTGNYDDKDGKKVYTTDVIIEEVEFCGSTQETTQETTQKTEITDDDLPF